ncbi:caspase family protein [Streptomyces sp. NBC_01537]|uniref:caspase family protein n=1 Tax=Streptomyces sp. NBC_01537 TaxID=2903896 RepID=UPI00386FF4AF
MEEKSRHALIIANDRYHDDGLRQLVSPAQDAAALGDVLSDPQIGDFDVQMVRNEPSHVITMRIDDFFSDRRPKDTLVVHFSCHGLKSESGELYFAASNTLPRRLASTAVPASFVRRCMAVTRARSIALFLDCCYGGAFSQGATARAAGDAHVLDSFAGEKLGGGRGWAVITASNSMEYAFEGSQLAEDAGARPSVFTSAVVSGLATGEADLDEDGRISLDELYEYVYDRVRQENPNQTPSRSVDMQGDLYLARSYRRRITSVPVPDDLRAAMRSADLYTRRGAIIELRSRMEHTDLSVAAGAREALEEMARQDIRAVADEATRALNEVRVNPYPAHLHFGQVGQNTPTPHQSVRLLGPPLARSCVPRPQSDWLHATESSDGLDVSVETATPGRLSGDLVLEGVVGTSVVHVDVEVLPAASAAPTQTAAVPPSPPPPPGPPHVTPPVPVPVPVPARRQTAWSWIVTRRAPIAAACALALAVMAGVTAVMAVVEATYASVSRSHEHPGGREIENFAGDRGLVPLLVMCLVTGFVALVVAAVARYDLGRPGENSLSRYTASVTRFTTRVAKRLALPSFLVALAILIAYKIAARSW